MSPCFADTHFFLALVTRKDPKVHAAAMQAHQSGRPLITTAWVIVELADHLCDLPNRAVFERLYAALASTPHVEVVPAEQTLMNRGIELYRSRRDKEWSLTDCISFLVMQDRGLLDALTADRHFEQAGFRAMLKD